MQVLEDLTLDPEVMETIRRALDEDIGSGDATTLALVDPTATATGEILARVPCTAAGVCVGRAVLRCVDPEIKVETVIPDGGQVPAGGVILRFQGRAASILTAERTALNFMQRMSGTATLAHRFTEAVAPYGTMILDTRKTTPGLRKFEKFAVRCGGGSNHRFGLFDRILMKDNHRKLWLGGDPDRLDLAVEAARKAYPNLAVEVEVESVEECRSALRAKPEWIMLDNMDCEMMRTCVGLCRGISKTEASGGITIERAAEVAATGVDAISLGCLTHSAPAVDLSLEWRAER
ncbi:MAG: carboxylating nicotinate-nucleotide diphosphorylase [Kiritimatiellae bacterium]|nr:carboxylating nicotinate-nucleotide diphosphorylase [Kiritimatiellia bacterium]